MKNYFFQYDSFTLQLDHLNIFMSFKTIHGEIKNKTLGH